MTRYHRQPDDNELERWHEFNRQLERDEEREPYHAAHEAIETGPVELLPPDETETK